MLLWKILLAFSMTFRVFALVVMEIPAVFGFPVFSKSTVECVTGCSKAIVPYCVEYCHALKQINLDMKDFLAIDPVVSRLDIRLDVSMYGMVVFSLLLIWNMIGLAKGSAFHKNLAYFLSGMQFWAIYAYLAENYFLSPNFPLLLAYNCGDMLLPFVLPMVASSIREKNHNTTTQNETTVFKSTTTTSPVSPSGNKGKNKKK